MHANRDQAVSAAERKLSELSSKERLLTRKEVDELLGFKARLQHLERQLQPFGLTIDQAMSEFETIEKVLPGEKPSAMAQTILQNYGVANPFTVEEARVSYLQHLASGYKREYSVGYLENAERFLGRFSEEFGHRRMDTIKRIEAEHFIDTYKVLRRVKGQPRRWVKASSRTRSHIKGHLQCFFQYAKNVLGALPKRLDTVIEQLPVYHFVTEKLPIYTAAEMEAVLRGCPDFETLLYVGLQAYAGLRHCEVLRLEGRDIKKDHILIRPEVGKKGANAHQIAPPPRKIPITPPLASILEGVRLSEGPLFVSTDLFKKICEVFAKAKVRIRRNGFRKSFVSHRLRTVKNRRIIAKEAGHDVLRQILNYEAEAWAGEVLKYWASRFSAEGLRYTRNHYAAKELRARVSADKYPDGRVLDCLALDIPKEPKRRAALVERLSKPGSAVAHQS